jgi:Protein of unknown function (DUF551)
MTPSKPQETTMPTGQRRANDLLRTLNQVLFGNAVQFDMALLPIAVGAVEDFWDMAQNEAKAVSPSPESRWISVKDRLPEINLPVIVHGGMAFRSQSGWYTLMEYPHRFITWEVTHWMPIPAPPSPESQPDLLRLLEKANFYMQSDNDFTVGEWDDYVATKKAISDALLAAPPASEMPVCPKCKFSHSEPTSLRPYCSEGVESTPTPPDGLRLDFQLRKAIVERLRKYLDPKEEDWEFDDSAPKWERHCIRTMADLLRAEASLREKEQELAREKEGRALQAETDRRCYAIMVEDRDKYAELWAAQSAELDRLRGALDEITNKVAAMYTTDSVKRLKALATIIQGVVRAALAPSEGEKP